MNLDRRNLFIDIRVYRATRAMDDCIALMNSCLRYLVIYGRNRRIKLIYMMAGCCLAAHVSVGHTSQVVLTGLSVNRSKGQRKRIVGRGLLGRSFSVNIPWPTPDTELRAKSGD